MPSRLSSTKAILPEPNKIDAEPLAIASAGMAQAPATQQPQPVLSQGAFFMGACFWTATVLAGIGMSGIIMAQGARQLASLEANAGIAPPRHNPIVTSKAMIRRAKKRDIRR
jgi:hypothetical protein